MIQNQRNSTKISRGIKTTLIGIFSSLVLAGIKIFSGIIGNSYALIADGIESIADVFTSLLVLTGLRIASKPADKNHPYGHGKAEPLAGLAVSISLFIAATIIIIQSTREIITPHHTPANFTLIVLVVVLIVKEILFRYIHSIGKSIDSVAVKNDAWHHRSDAITSGAAFLGILIAILGGKGYEIADDIAALFASFIIYFNAYKLMKPAIYELMDKTLDHRFIEELKSDAGKLDGVIEVEKMFCRKVGLNYLVDSHIKVNGTLSVHEGHAIAHNVKGYLINKYPQIAEVLIHIEPYDN